MTSFEFVSVLLSIVVSLAFTHLLTGIARLIRARPRKFPLLHVGWLGLMLFNCVDYWFSLWQLRSIDWSLGYVLFWLLYATLLYLTCWLLVPPEEQALDSIDIDEYHINNRRQYLSVLLTGSLLTLPANFLTPTMAEANWFTLFGIIVFAVAWWSPNRLVQYTVLGICYPITIWYAITYIPSV